MVIKIGRHEFDGFEFTMCIIFPIAMTIFIFLALSGILSHWSCDYIQGRWVELYYPNGQTARGYCEYELTTAR